MPIDFPSNPQLDELYSAEDRTWRWTGVYWRAVSTTIGYTGSQGEQGEGFRVLGSFATVADLPADSSGLPGDAYVIISTGEIWVWDGFNWNNLGQFVGYTGSQGDLGFTGSKGEQGTSVRLIGSVPTEQDLPSDGTSDGSTLLVSGDGFIVNSTGELYIWDGFNWSNVGRIVGPIGFTGYTGSQGYTGSSGYTGSQGESSFTWGPTPPPDPTIGDRWFDTIEGGLAVYTDDGNSLQWVEVAASGFLGQTGYTGSEGSVGRSIAMTIVFGGG